MFQFVESRFTARAAGRVAVTLVVAVALLGVGAYAGAQSGDPNTPAPGAEAPRAGAASPTENVFVPITPCRIVNSQIGPRIGVGETRAYRMHGNTSSQGGAASCGIPSTATALEVTVHAVLATGNGYLRVFPATGAEPNATFINYGSGLNQSNTGTITVTPGGGNSFRVKAYQRSTHVIVDVAGYYVSDLFAIVNSNGTLARGNGVVSTAGNITGFAGAYEVVFNRNITGCSFGANLGDGGVNTFPGEVSVTNRNGIANGVFVRTFNSSGVATNQSFHLTVDC